ncbi:hypothetical protein [Microbacterium sp. NPDC058389]
MAWIDALAYIANTPSGLYLVPEPPEPPAHDDTTNELSVVGSQ